MYLDRGQITSLRSIQIAPTSFMPDVGGDLLGIARRPVEVRRGRNGLGAPSLRFMQAVEVVKHVLGVQPVVFRAVLHDRRFQLLAPTVRLYGELALSPTPGI